MLRVLLFIGLCALAHVHARAPFDKEKEVAALRASMQKRMAIVTEQLTNSALRLGVGCKCV
jgi:hypothetical protein